MGRPSTPAEHRPIYVLAGDALTWRCVGAAQALCIVIEQCPNDLEAIWSAKDRVREIIREIDARAERELAEAKKTAEVR